MYKYLLLLALLTLTDSLVQGIGYVYMRVLDPPDIPFMMKLSLAHIGPAFNVTYVNYLIPTVRENSCHTPQETLGTRRPLAGSIALIMRGGCSFVGKIINAHVSGALAAIVYDSNPLASLTLNMVQDETSRKVLIPSAFMSGRDGYTITDALLRWNRTRAQVDFPLNATILSKRVHIVPLSLW
ncbi:hypothetical protein AHF37_00085 [Paragonimus kellicotti]|nr:hypothetical protein AHF37_00085 [Paragonimus kellicotti]